MTYGMNLLLWGTEINEDLFPVLEQIKEIGFDGVEIPIFDVNPEKWYSWRQKLDELDLKRIAVTINGGDFNQISADENMRKSTLERNKRAIDCAMILGSDLLTGPFHSALGVFTGVPPTKDELLWAKENLWDLAEYADSMGITLGLEYLNRFESYLVSSSDELLALVEDINHPACAAMLARFEILEMNRETAKQYAVMTGLLRRQNQLIGTNDLWIAAAALAAKIPVVTNNAIHFCRIPGLSVVAY